MVGEDGLLREVLKRNYYLGLISLLILMLSFSSYDIMRIYNTFLIKSLTSLHLQNFDLLILIYYGSGDLGLTLLDDNPFIN